MAEKTAAERVALARHPQRPNITDYIDGLFTDFFEQRGDRACREDPAILGGIALFHGRPVTVIGTRKGKTLEENLRCNFGMPGPEGYRKALRLMKQAEKFRRPIFTFIDTAGAYPGLEAEEHGQGEAIARNLFEMSRLTVPVIAVVTGEGNSGGALALAVADRVLMLENAVYAILSPEGFASILWKDAQRSGEAAELPVRPVLRLYDEFPYHSRQRLRVCKSLFSVTSKPSMMKPCGLLSERETFTRRHVVTSDRSVTVLSRRMRCRAKVVTS